MKVVYRAENIIDANLVKGILENAGIRAFINGSFLQGGIGELPASGLISVAVSDSDVAEADRLVKEFDESPAPDLDAVQWDESDPLPDC